MTSSEEASLFSIWNRRLKIVHTYAEFTRAWVRLILGVQFYGTLITLLLAPFINSERSSSFFLFLYTGGVLHLAIIFFLRRKVWEFYQATLKFSDASDAIVPVIDALEAKVRERLAPMAKILNVSYEKIRLYSDLDDWGESPRMIETDGLMHIILPLGFAKVLEERPSAAEAMLAHELGHAAQRDTASWIYATAFSQFVFRWLIPLFGVQLLIVLLWAVIAPEKIMTQVETGRNTHIETTYRIDLQTGFPLPEYQPITEVTYQTIETTIPTPVDKALRLLFPLFLVISYLIIRGGRRASEEMADLAALLASSADGLYSALTVAPGSSSSKPILQFHSLADKTIFPIHPPLEWRIRQIEKYRSVAHGLPTKGEPVVVDKAPGDDGGQRLKGRLLIGGSAILAALGLAAVSVSETSSGFSVLAVSLLCLAGATYLWGMICLMRGILARKPVSRMRLGSFMICLAVLLASMFVPLSGLINFPEWSGPAVLVGIVLSLLIGLIGLLWVIIGWLGREIK